MAIVNPITLETGVLTEFVNANGSPSVVSSPAHSGTYCAKVPAATVGTCSVEIQGIRTADLGGYE